MNISLRKENLVILTILYFGRCLFVAHRNNDKMINLTLASERNVFTNHILGVCIQ